MLLIKRSHLTSPIQWHKHIEDYYELKSFTNKVDIPAYNKRRNEVLSRQQVNVNLNMSNDEFFNKTKNVKRSFAHHHIHKAVAYGPKPLYEMMKKDVGKALISHAIFLSSSLETQLRLVREEAYAIAL